MLSSKLRSFSFSLPSANVQSPSNRSRTFRVGADVIGTSYWQAVKARMHRQAATPKPDLRQTKFDESPPEFWTSSALFSNHLGSFDAITSIFSIEGDFVRSSD